MAGEQIDKPDYTLSITKSATGKALEDQGVPAADAAAALGDVNQQGYTESNDVKATRQVIAPNAIPLSYKYDEKQMLANMSAAISSDVEDMKESELIKDETFGYASRKMYRAFIGEDFVGSDVEATQYGIDLMRKVENNLAELGNFSVQVQNMSQEDAQTALYMMDMFEAKEFTWRGFGEAMGYMSYDPTTYIGLGSFGWGFAGREAATAAAKKSLVSTLGAIAMKPAVTGAAEGGAYTAAFEHGRQKVSEAAGEGYDSGSVGLNTLMGTSFGGAAGKYLPEIFDYAGDKVSSWAKGGRFQEAVQTAAANGDEDAIKVLEDMTLLDRWADQFAVDTEEEMAKLAGGGTPPDWSAPEFYSKLSQALTDTNQKTWNKQQLEGFLKKQGVKDEEMQWSGVKDYLDSLDGNAKVTTGDLLSRLEQPDLNTVVKGDTVFMTKNYLDQLDPADKEIAKKMINEPDQEKLTDGTYDDQWDLLLEKYPALDHNIIHDVADERAAGKTVGDTKYKDYRTKDVGKNYREELTIFGGKMSDKEREANKLYDEIASDPKKYPQGSEKYNEYEDLTYEVSSEKTGLVTKPIDGKDGIKYFVADAETGEAAGGGTMVFDTEKEAKNVINRKAVLKDNKGAYNSSHWDDNNVLYHVRKQDVDLDGENTMLIEEIQSDWHQEGRKSGYKDGNDFITLRDKAFKEHGVSKYDELPDEVKTKLDDVFEKEDSVLGKVPQAPYSKTWHEKAMKDQISEAVANGYNRVAWVSGKDQTDRYSLAKQVDEIKAMKIDGKYYVGYKTHAGDLQEIPARTDEELVAAVGKDMADKIKKDTEAAPQEQQTYSGVDLEVGGEGMKAFYDEMLPKWTNKYIKKYGSKVEVKTLPNGQEVWSFEVTPKMKEEIKSKGQPLYSAGASLAAGGAAIDQLAQEDENGRE